MDEKLNLESKLETLFNNMNSLPDFPIEDDTVLQKLQSTLKNLINKESKPVIWCKKIGLISFVTGILEETCISQEKNHSLSAFALSCFSSLVENEESFIFLMEDKVMKNFRQCLPETQKDMSVTSSALKVTESLIMHKSGLNWVISNNIWENFLYFLKSQNIFIRKSSAKILIAILLNVDSQKFTKYIHDVENMLRYREEEIYDFRSSITNGSEDDYSLASSVSKLKSDTQAVLQFFHSLLLEGLGKKSLYHSVKIFHDLLSQIIFHYDINWTSEAIIIVSKLLLLGNIHKNLNFGDGGQVKEFCVDYFILDTVNLMQNMISKGYHNEFVGSTFDVYKYWNFLLQNISENNKTVSSHVESVSDFFILFQVLPLHAMCCKSFLVASTEADAIPNKESYETWRVNSIQKIFGGYTQNLKLRNILELNLEKLSQESQTIEEQSTSHLLKFSSILNYLNITCAQYLLQTIIYLLHWKTKMKLSLDYDSRFYLHVVSVLKSIIERFDIDWTKCEELNSLHISLCSIIKIRGIDTRVKIVCFQTIKSSIDKSLYPWKFSKSRHNSNVDLEKLKEDYYCSLFETTSLYLSDIEWEVRDSALEVICCSMNVENSELKSICNNFEKFNILNLVLQAVGDIEPYVQSSALNVLSAVISIDVIWSKLNGRELKQKALRSIVKSGEASIRKSGLNFLRSLLINSKFQVEEINKYVIPVVQSTCSDSDDDVRLSSVSIFRYLLFSELEKIGIQDTNRMESESSLTSYAEFRFSTEEIENTILVILTRFCLNGCFQCILNRLHDNIKSISSEAQYICKYVSLLVNKYCLLDKLTASLRKKKMKTSSNLKEMDYMKSQNDTFMDVEAHTEIEHILQTSDLAVISKLRNKENEKGFWWNGEPEEEYLKVQEIPFELVHVDEKLLLDVIENGPQVKISDENSSENEMHLLLEDVFLAMSPHSGNESRAQDCY